MPPRHGLAAVLIGTLPLLLSCAAPAAEAPPLTVTAAPAPAPAPALPAWLTTLITKLEAQPLTNPPARVVQYDYAGRTVYYLPPKCCDFPSQLLDAEGHRLCSPDGGFTGHGDGQCADFRAARSKERLIWKDERTRELPR